MADAAAKAPLASGDHRALRIQLAGDAIAALIVLFATTVLAVYKPKGMTPYGQRKARQVSGAAIVLVLTSLFWAGSALAHGVSEGDRSFLTGSSGMHLVLYAYLGAKHMVTGYDHLLFLVGVIFFLHRMKDVGVYVTLFAVGHSTTLLLGVLNGWHINPYLVDGIIGLSIVYRALDNLGAYETVLRVQPNKKAAVLLFGFVHGLGLATKLQDFSLSVEGLIPNMVAFNVGVEIGQLLALGTILVLMRYWRSTPSFARYAMTGNIALMTAGFVLAGYQFTGFLTR